MSVIKIDFNVMAGTFPDGRIVTVTEVLKLLDRAHIDQAVISSPGTLDDSDENAFLYRETRGHLDRLIPLAILNPKRAQVREEYARIGEYGFKAIKFDPLNHGYQPVCCQPLDLLLAKIQTDYPFVCMTTGMTTLGDPAQWLSWLKKYPQLKFIFLGMGAFDFGYGCVDYAAQYANIYLETSLQYEIQIIKKALHLLQGGRILFGSGLPYRTAEVELLKLQSMDLTAEQLAQMTCLAAKQLLTENTVINQKL